MTYQLTPEMVESITDADLAFSTVKYLPPEVEIPEDFFEGNIYTQLASSIFYGTKRPKGDLEMHEGFEIEPMVKCIRAHLGSFAPQHEHKISGVGYMISLMCTITPDAD